MASSSISSLFGQRTITGDDDDGLNNNGGGCCSTSGAADALQSLSFLSGDGESIVSVMMNDRFLLVVPRVKATTLCDEKGARMRSAVDQMASEELETDYEWKALKLELFKFTLNGPRRLCKLDNGK